MTIDKCIADLLKPPPRKCGLCCVTCDFSPKWMALSVVGVLSCFSWKRNLKHVNTLPIPSLLVELLTSQKYFKVAAKLSLVSFPS